MASEPDPQWLSQAWRGFVDEWMHYGQTALAVARAPRRFMRQWSDGERHALNPLACLFNAIAIITSVKVITRLAMHRADDRPEWLELLGPASNLFNIAIIASLVHFPLRLLGGRRPWRTTLASTMYVVACPMTPLYLLRDALFPTIVSMHGGRFYEFMGPLALVLFGYQITSLAGAQRLSWWRPLIAFLLGFSVFVVVGAALRLAKLI